MGELVLGRQDGKRQVRRARASSLTPRKRQAFLDALAMTCNVRVSAAHAEVSKAALYQHRARDPQFVEQWREALAAGYDRLEALVLEHGGAGMALEPADPNRAVAHELPPFDFDKALAVLRQYRNKRDGLPVPRGGRPRVNATREETNAALIKAIDAAARRMAKAQRNG